MSAWVLDPWPFLIVALASFRITRFLVFDSLVGANIESGSRFAAALDVWAWDDGADRPGFGGWVRDKIGTLLSCPWCVGFWVAVAAVAWWAELPDARWVLVPWAVAGAASILSTWERR